MTAKRMNVLVYSGPGSTIDAVRHCFYTLRRLLAANYAVIPIDGDALLKEPWPSTCALLVMPGGADLGFCRTLNGQGNRRIRQYVERGGSYLGFCAGAYYGSGRCEFEIGNKDLEVVGNRELGFFPGTCRGLAFPGFAYNSERGVRAAELKVHKEAILEASVPDSFRSYYNGGGVFVEASIYNDSGVEILAEYTEQLQVDAGKRKAAAVYCSVGNGGVILSNTHIEFAPVNLDHGSKVPGLAQVIKALEEDDSKRRVFLRGCLSKLNLAVDEVDTTIPTLSKLHLSSLSPSGVASIIELLQDIILTEDELTLIKGENDTFRLEERSSWTTEDLTAALPQIDGTIADTAEDFEAQSEPFRDYDKAVKQVVLHHNGAPTSRETPYFNHQAFYANLNHYSGHEQCESTVFGKDLLYGDVVTSTNTLLEKNLKLLSKLPSGFTATANCQIAGRGRGSNVWVSPAGSLMFSTVIRHPTSLASRAPVIFLQYLAALAIVQGIKTYGPGFGRLPIKLKWPNDIYAIDPVSKKPVKIGGILVNSHYNSTEFLAVVGIGLNTTNTAPTISLNALNPPVPFTLEKLLARVLVTFSELYKTFCRTGFNKTLEATYYEHWLHSDQIVTLETEGGTRARIKGITSDWGLLVAEELGWEDRPTGRKFQLQSDSNSFDFMKGLVRRKL